METGGHDGPEAGHLGEVVFLVPGGRSHVRASPLRRQSRPSLRCGAGVRDRADAFLRLRSEQGFWVVVRLFLCLLDFLLERLRQDRGGCDQIRWLNDAPAAPDPAGITERERAACPVVLVGVCPNGAGAAGWGELWHRMRTVCRTGVSWHRSSAGLLRFHWRRCLPEPKRAPAAGCRLPCCQRSRLGPHNLAH